MIEFQVAMLLKPHLCSFCKSLIGDQYHNCMLTYWPYENLEEMSLIFDQIKSDFDGVITSGLIPHSLVLSKQADEISAACFGFDIENTYRIILEQSVQRKDFSLSRIGIDFIPRGQDPAQVIAENRLPGLVKDFEKWLRSIPPEQLSTEEKGIASQYLERYRKGEIDFIVTYFYSTVLEMHSQGIDCFYLYPNEREIGHAFDVLENHIRLRCLAQPATVRIELRPGREETASLLEHRMINLERLLQRMIGDNGAGIALKRQNYAIELYTDSHALRRLTDGYHRCFFRQGLTEELGFTGTIGYGVASDFYHARLNAIDACSYASNFQDAHMRSVMMGQGEQMIHMKQDTCGTPAASVSSQRLLSAAQAVKLSPETLLRILEVIRAEGSKEISSTELTGRLGVSLRTANRFLSHLLQGGYAKIVGYRPNVGKGRPIAVYQVDLEQEA